MVKVNLIAVGSVKEKYFSEGIEEYKKRLKKYCSFNIIEVSEESYYKENEGNVDKIKEKEGERIISQLSGYVILCSIDGKKVSSTSFADKIKKIADEKGGVITFVIGGSHGVSKEVEDRANEKISFSDLTFPHTLFRLMLTEQIYRAFSILAGSAYHK